MKTSIRQPIGPLTIREEQDVIDWIELRTEGYHTARITCRVCGLPATVPVSAPALLCNPCRSDSAMTRLHVETILATCETRWQAAYEAWEVAVAPHTERWLKIEEARLATEPEVFLVRWNKTKALGGDFAALLVQREAFDELSDELNGRREWAAKALEEIDAYERG
jgi:hypothetical protein